ncbi:MAG: hypothetical protein JJ902_05185 [Roseibium sp.]|nr:hypothetical protein [Roseibium sp.]
MVDKPYTAWLHELPCVVTGYIGEEIQQAHIRFADAAADKDLTGGGRKPDDFWSLPLHWMEHARQHSMGERAYWEMVGKDPLALCRQLHAMHPATRRATTFILSQVRRTRR